MQLTYTGINVLKAELQLHGPSQQNVLKLTHDCGFTIGRVPRIFLTETSSAVPTRPDTQTEPISLLKMGSVTKQKHLYRPSNQKFFNVIFQSVNLTLQLGAFFYCNRSSNNRP